MGKKVEQGEQDRERFLYSHEPVKWPLPVELNDGFHHWRVSSFSFVGDNMLASIVTFLWAIPKEQTMSNSYNAVSHALEESISNSRS